MGQALKASLVICEVHLVEGLIQNSVNDNFNRHDPTPSSHPVIVLTFVLRFWKKYLVWMSLIIYEATNLRISSIESTLIVYGLLFVG